MICPRISICIPLITKGNAQTVLQSLQKINYPKKYYEIFIVEGTQIAKQRNKAIKIAKGNILYFLDDDARILPVSLRILAKEFVDLKVGVVGGPSLTPQNGSYMSRLIGYVLETYFGALRMRHRYSQQLSTQGTEYQLIGANFAIKKTIAVKIKGFDEKIVPNEETEFFRRILNHGFQLKYNKNMYIYRNQRKNITELSKQFFHYGKGRMMQIKKSYVFQDSFFIAPVGFGGYAVSLLFIHSLWYFLPLLFYLLVGIVTAFKAAIKYKNISLLITMPLIFPIVHISYACGLVVEAIAPLHLKEKNKYITVKFIKNFEE